MSGCFVSGCLLFPNFGSPGNEFPGSITEVPLGLHGQSEALRGLLYFSLIFQCQAFCFGLFNIFPNFGSPGNEFPGSITEVPLGLHGQSESLRGLQYFSLIFQCQAFCFGPFFFPNSQLRSPNFGLFKIFELQGCRYSIDRHFDVF